MESAHTARIRWSAEQVRRGLPAEHRTVDPSWFSGDLPSTAEGWSLVCEFDAPPAVQGSPSLARVRFLVAAAPHDRLGRGARLQLFERATGRCAEVEILD